MQRFLLSLCTLFISVSLHAEVGFYPLNDAKVPKAVAEKAKKGVFRVIFVSNPKNVNQKQLDTLLDQMKGDPFARDFIKDFQKKNPPKEAEFPLFFQSSGTCFLVEHGGEQYLVMGRFEFSNHPFAEIMYEYMDQAPAFAAKNDARKNYFKKMLTEIQKIKVYPYLFDSEGKMIYDLKVKGNFANFVIGATTTLLGDYHHYKDSKNEPYLPLDLSNEIDIRTPEFLAANNATNFVFLKLNNSLPKENASALKWAKAPADAAKEEIVYSVGFPGLTENRKKEMKPDSDGKSMYVSYGPVMSAANQYKLYFQRFIDKKEKILMPEKFLSEILLSHETDGTLGISGAPVLNKDGDVLGMVGLSTGVRADIGNPGRVRVLSSGPSAPFMQEMLTELEKIRKK